MSRMIHPTAVIHPKAALHESVEVGPFAVIDESVTVGAGSVVGPHAHLTGVTTIGTGNRIHSGCVLGDAPQDLKYNGQSTRLRIGNDNVFREHVTVHRSTTADGETVIGSHCFLMANSHVGHNAAVGNHVILANGALLAGHVQVADRVFISGNCLVHQFVRIGTLALMQGGSAISKDLPPFSIARGDNHICGLNVVGLRRAGLTALERQRLKQLYHALFRRGDRLSVALEKARGSFTGTWEQLLIDFAATSRRGMCSDVSVSYGSSLEDAPED